MPRKCSFYRKEYTQAGVYEEHLGTTHANVDMILASIVQYSSPVITDNNDTEIDQLHHKGHQHPDSDYKPDPDSTWREHDAFNESDTEMLHRTQVS